MPQAVIRSKKAWTRCVDDEEVCGGWMPKNCVRSRGALDREVCARNCEKAKTEMDQHSLALYLLGFLMRLRGPQ